MYKRVLMVAIFAVGLLSHFALANEMKAPAVNKEMASMGNGGNDMMTMSMNNHQHHHMDNLGMWMFNVMPMYMNMDGLQSGTNSVSGSSSDMMVPKSMNMYMLMFMAMYMRGDWSVMLMNSYNIKTMDMDMNMMGKTTSSSMRSEGFSDTQVVGGYNLINTKVQKLQLQGGVSLPTGRINYSGDMPMMSDTLYGYPMQMGSGTFDPILGINYTYFWHKLVTSAELETLQRLYKNYRSYQLGDVYQLTLLANYQVLSLLSVGSKLQGIITTKTDGVAAGTNANWGVDYNPANSGGKVINLFATARISGSGVLQGQSLAIEAGYPIYQNLNGTQMKQGWQASVALNFMFM
ncbi:transporter [Fangia hongkongensis]|uniref:transporter n=1 Tax=Fangia hongkongensis TaxID=270495 RepID=UPI0003648401|nr:transporter [Fangia hongkongensis]MBK2124131.1 hypothetical protein [Fangia hongkongensis]